MKAGRKRVIDEEENMTEKKTQRGASQLVLETVALGPISQRMWAISAC
jgi:hypothetical protein